MKSIKQLLRESLEETRTAAINKSIHNLNRANVLLYNTQSDDNEKLETLILNRKTIQYKVKTRRYYELKCQILYNIRNKKYLAA